MSPPSPPFAEPAPARAAAGGEGESLWGDLAAFKRDRILHEAAGLFLERGYAQTSVDAVAERLGVSKPFIYYHFRSKAELLVAICERGTADALQATLAAVAGPGAPHQRFVRFVRDFTAAVLKHHRFTAIYFREGARLPREQADRIHAMRKSIDQSLRALLRDGVASGEFELDDPQISALVIAGMSSYAFAWYRETGRLDPQDITDSIVQMALKLVGASGPRLPAPA